MWSSEPIALTSGLKERKKQDPKVTLSLSIPPFISGRTVD